MKSTILAKINLHMMNQKMVMILKIHLMRIQRKNQRTDHHVTMTMMFQENLTTLNSLSDNQERCIMINLKRRRNLSIIQDFCQMRDLSHLVISKNVHPNCKKVQLRRSAVQRRKNLLMIEDQKVPNM